MPDGFWIAPRPDRMARETLPVARPLLPTADAILPYLREADAARTYANHGPLTRRLERRLAEHLGTPPGSVATVANATLGLALALAASGARPGTLCLMPAWTFAASAHAAILAGLRPHFLDVGEDGALRPDAVEAALAALPPGRAGAAMAVAPFGAPLDTAAWDALAARTGLPVVLDAAAGFDGLTPGRCPAVVSLHATKILGAGEGGFLVCRDAALVREVECRANFGFAGSREARLPAMNAKLSEYAAAVAHAALDAWPATRARAAAAGRRYGHALRALPGVTVQPGFGTDWVSSTAVASFAAGADPVARALSRTGIETRRWWPRGLHEEPAFAGHEREPLPVTDRLAAATLGLPFHVDLPPAAIDRVADALAAALSHTPVPA